MQKKENACIKRKITVYGMASALFLLIMLPTLFSIFVWGSDMNYNVVNKVPTLYNNKILLLMALPVVCLFFLLFYLTRNVKINKICNCILQPCLIGAFTGMYFINFEICKCNDIAQGWDVSIVVGAAYELFKGHGIESSYFSIYPNNVPIVFVLQKLFSLADRIPDFPYVNDYMWLIVICIMISVAGYFTCLSIQKITNNLAAVLIAFVLYVGCVCVTPWKMVPYTDMFAILFPLMSFSLYVFSYYSKNAWWKYAFWFAALAAGFIGSLVKPTVLIIPIAIILCEVVKAFGKLKKNWKDLLVRAIIVAAVVLLYLGCKNYIYEDTRYVQDEEIKYTALHFFMMGLNEESTGSYAAGDSGISGGEMLLADRTRRQIEVSIERLKEKGVFGYIYFLHRKTVMTFNDGAFGWGREGGYIPETYPIYSQSSYVSLIRDIFLPNYLYSKHLNTYSQGIWLLIIFSLPGLCFVEKEKREACLPLLVSLIGVILYLMLFEARARYLICFLPIIIAAATLGISQYYRMLKLAIIKIKEKQKTKKEKVSTENK